MKRFLCIACLLLVVSAEIAFLIPSKKRLVIVVLPDKTSYKTDYWTTGGPPPNEIATGEYYHLARRNDSVFDISQGIPILIATGAIHIFAGAHNAGYIDTNHRAWIEGSNGSGEQGTNNASGGNTSYGLQEALTDSSGTVQLYYSDIQFGQAHTAYTGTQSYWFGAGISYTDSSVWVWGMLYGGRCGNGTACSMRSPGPVKVNLPGGEKAVQIRVSWTIVVRCLSGNVYTWGAGDGGIDGSALGQGNSPNYNTPTQISLPAPATMIAGAGLWSYAKLNNGTLYMWGSVNHSRYQTLASGNTRVPINITSNLGFAPSSIVDIEANDESTYCILSDGTMRDWGSRAQGSLGDGTEIDFARYGSSPLPYGSGYPPATPLYYAYDQGYNETGAGVSVVIQIAPINPTPGKTNWIHVSTNACGYCFQAWAQDTYGQWYFCGRDKESLPNRVRPWQWNNGAMQNRYGNAWDKKDWIWCDLFQNQTTIYGSPSPDCLSSGTQLWSDACALYPISTSHTPPVARLTLTPFQSGGKWYVKSDASASTGGDVLVSYKHRGTANGVALDRGVCDRPIDTIGSANGVPLAPGTVVNISTTVYNNYFDSTIASATITIPSSACTNCITLPINIKFH